MQRTSGRNELGGDQRPQRLELGEERTGGNTSMGEAGQAPWKAAGWAVMPDHSEDLLHGHPPVSSVLGI